MARRCTACGEPMVEGLCLNDDCDGLSGGGEPPGGGQPEAEPPEPPPPVGEGLPLPKPDIKRRLMGSGAEFLGLAAIDLVFLLLGWGLGLFGGIAAVFTSTLAGWIIGFIPGFLLLVYMIVRDMGGGKYSFGKRWKKMQVVDIKELKPASNGQAALRNSYYIVALLGVFLDPFFVFGWGLVAAMMMVDLILIWRSDRGRRLGDYLAGTQVIPLADWRHD